MSSNIKQIFDLNPAASMQSTDLIYLGRSPYGTTDDFAILWSNLQTSITAVGTISSGVWNGTLIGSTYGGTGVNNGASTITIGGNFAMSGAFAFTGTLTNTTSVTFPVSGTLATTAQLPTPSALTRVDDTNVTLTLGGTPSTALLQAVSLTLGWTGTLSPARGGTGTNNGTSTINLGSPTTGYVLTSDVSGNATWQAVASSGAITTIQGDSGSASPVAGTVSITGGATGLTTSGSGSTLSLAGTLAVANGGSGTSTAFTQGSVVFAGASGIYTQDNASFFYDATNKYLGIGTAVPTANLHIARATAATSGSASYLSVVGAADTGLSVVAGNNGILVNIDGSNTRTWASAPISSFASVNIARSTSAFDSANTILFASTVDITGTPRSGNNVTTTQAVSLRVRGPNTVTGTGVCTQGYGIYCAAPFGATTNYSGIFFGGNFGIGTDAPTAVLQVTRSATGTNAAQPFLKVTLANEATLTASTEIPMVAVETGTRTWSAGALSLQRDSAFGQPTYAFSSASTITNAATIGISGAPAAGTNATITNSHALLISAAAVGSGVTNSYGLTVNAQTGAGNANYIAAFTGTGGTGRGVGIGTVTPSATLNITRSAAATFSNIRYLYVQQTADTGLLASTEIPSIENATATRTWAAGAISMQRDNLFGQPTYAFASSSTITNAATLAIVGAPVAGTNAAITTSHGLLISAGAVGAGTTTSYGLTVNAQTGATNNFAAQFVGGSVLAPSVVITKVDGTEAANAVTTNGSAGVITTSSLTTAAGGSYAITWTNSSITATSGIQLTVVGGTNTVQNFRYSATRGAGTSTLTIYNTDPSAALNGTILLSYLIY
jgi:hypothetical protein